MKNSGFKTSGNIKHTGKKEQYIVIGVGRGGTSAIAASLNTLGITLSGDFNEPIYEDIEMAKAFRSRDWRSFKRLIASYEAKYQKFAWKLRGILRKNDEVRVKPKGCAEGLFSIYS